LIPQSLALNGRTQLLSTMFHSLLFFLLILLITSCTFSCAGIEGTYRQPMVFRPRTLVYVFISVIICSAPEILSFSRIHHQPAAPRQVIIRQRKQVSTIFREVSPHYMRRAYRMDENSFYALHRMLRPHLRYLIRPPVSSTKKFKNGAHNGLINSTVRLSCALRYFAGGSPYDIACMHGVFHTEVFKSVWRVVDAVNQCKQLKIKFPEDHDEQSRIAAEFEKKSRAGFKNCVGAIDGILISTEKPNMKDCEMTSCGPKKFFCGRKKKFGLNMQATCDARARFLDVSICHPGSTSDYLAFATSPLKHKLERPGFLAPGLVLFGDNAYVNTNYMVTPFKAVSSGPKDDYNFYHSQVRIKVECSFGILVHGGESFADRCLRRSGCGRLRRSSCVFVHFTTSALTRTDGMIPKQRP
jgi:hypothetical protein